MSFETIEIKMAAVLVKSSIESSPFKNLHVTTFKLTLKDY